jgi:hypothetical protein
MKSVRLIVVILFLGIAATSCQSFSLGGSQANTPAVPEGNSNTAMGNPAYPYPGSDRPGAVPAYPGPNLGAQAMTFYPALKDGDKIEWDQVAGALYSGQVESVAQAHDLQVTLKLKDGRTLVSTEPAIDDIINMVKQCGDPCKDIRIATE